MATKKKRIVKTKKRDFNRLTDNDLRYVINSEYDVDHPCESGSDCCDNDYCRCGIIINAHVPIDVNNSYSIALKTAKNQGLVKDFRFYCLERLISCLLRQNPDCFDVTACGGYYGQEISGVTLKWDVINPINNFIEQLDKRKSKSHYRILIESVLALEYTYVLPAIVGKDWEYERISLQNIYPGNDHYSVVKSSIVDQYANEYVRHKKDYLSCLCKKVGEKKFVLVDGYHRYAAAKKRDDKSMMVMWCKGR